MEGRGLRCCSYEGKGLVSISGLETHFIPSVSSESGWDGVNFFYYDFFFL